MSERKLKIILNKEKPWKSRVIDSESGAPILGYRAVDVHLAPDKVPVVTITLDQFDIEIEQEPETPS